MKVAWHEVPGKIGSKDPSRRDRMIVWKPLNGRSIDNSASPSRYLLPTSRWQIVPSLRDGTLLSYHSRHFVPGYLHTVPTGHRPYRYPVFQQSARVSLRTLGTGAKRRLALKARKKNWRLVSKGG